MYQSESFNRRGFLKTLALAPVIPGAALSALSEGNAIVKPFTHHFKLSLNAYSFNKPLRAGETDLFDLLDFCAENNFDAIDPTGYYFPGYPDVPSIDYINRFKKEAFLRGLDISGTGIRNDFANPDPSAREADKKLIRQWIKASAQMGVNCLRIFDGNHAHEGFAREKVFDWMAAEIRECCEYGKDYGVMVALQNHNEFLKTADDVNLLFEMVDSQWLGLNLDIGSYRKNDPYEEIRKNIHHAITWQVKENVWIDGKETPTDFVRLFKIIKDAGYRGYLPLETLGEGDPFEKVPVLLENVRNALSLI